MEACPRLFLVATLVSACTVFACAQQAPQPGSGAAPAAPTVQDQPAPEKPALSPEADAVLTALERAGAQIRALAAEVRYDRYSPLMGDRQTRIGKLFFENPRAGEPSPPG